MPAEATTETVLDGFWNYGPVEDEYWDFPIGLLPKSTRTLRPGYVYEWDGSDWDTVVYAPAGTETFLYQTQIDGAACAVFVTIAGSWIAQTLVSCRN